MSDEEWFKFFAASARVLGAGASTPADSASWCGWTTFAAFQQSFHYWSAGLPAASELTSTGIGDGGTWGQPFLFQSLAHVVIPRQFYWESISPTGFSSGTKQQDIERLSRELRAEGVRRRLADLVLEIKLYLSEAQPFAPPDVRQPAAVARR